MKIGILGTRGFPDIQGGVETHCEELYKRLGQSQINQFYIYRRKNYLPANNSTVYPNVVFVDFWVPKNKYLETFFHTFLGFFHLLFFVKPKLVHLHNIGPGMFSIFFRMAGIKVVLTYHSQNYFHQKWNKIAKKVLLVFEFLSIKYANAIIFVSKVHQEEITKKYKVKNSYYIPNGVSTVDVCPNVQNNFLSNHQLIPKKYLLSVGRITPEKGFDYLIEAYKSCQELQNIPLVIVGGDSGEKEYFDNLKKISVGTPVKFLGKRNKEELSILYKNCLLFILPSYFEGNPLVLLEAISYKVKAIASNIPSNKEIGLPHKHYFDCGNKTSLLKVLINTIHEDDSTSYYLDQKYNWQSIAEATSKLYEEISLA